MTVKEILNRMFHSFFVILGGSVISMFVFLLIFGTDGIIHTHDLGALIGLSAAADLSFFIFYSKNELSRNHLFVRYIIHMVYILSEMLFFAHFMGWLDPGKTIQAVVFVGFVVVMYIMVWVISSCQAKKTAHKLNEKLQERYRQGQLQN